MSRRKQRDRVNKNKENSQQPKNSVPYLSVTIKLHSGEKKLIIDPNYNNLSIEYIDGLYIDTREDYNLNWIDDHKIAYYMLDTFEGIFDEYMETIGTPEALTYADPTTLAIKNLQDAPVRDVIDIRDMKRV
jgi:hypothetical protein